MSDKSGLIIKNGTIVNNDFIVEADILIEDGKISKIEPTISDESCNVIDAFGCFVFPGGIDSETYFNAERGGIKSSDSYSSGTQKALCGGTTTVVNCIEVTNDENIKTRVEEEIKIASEEAVCCVAFQVGLSNFSASTQTEFQEVINSKTIVPSVRLSTVGKGAHLSKLEDEELFEAFCWCRDVSVLPCVIAENDKLISKLETELLESGITGPEGHYFSRNERVEDEAVLRVLSTARQAGCPVHLSRVYSDNAVRNIDIFRRQKDGWPLSIVGTNLVALTHTAKEFFTGTDWASAASLITVPSLKQNSTTSKYTSSLMHRLAAGQIQVVSSGHLLFETKHKATGKNDFRLITPGVHGVKERLGIVWDLAVKTGLIDKTRFVECMSTAPAKLHGLYPQKGIISVGSDADIVIWKEDTGKINEDQTEPDLVFGSIDTFSGPTHVIVGGQIVLESGAVQQKAIDLLRANEDGLLVKSVRYNGENQLDSISCQMQQAQVLRQKKVQKEIIVEREPYDGPVVDISGESTKEKCVLYSDMVNADVYQRRKEEERKEALPPGQRVVKTSVKTAQPPGGAAVTSSWWG